MSSSTFLLFISSSFDLICAAFSGRSFFDVVRVPPLVFGYLPGVMILSPISNLSGFVLANELIPGKTFFLWISDYSAANMRNFVLSSMFLAFRIRLIFSCYF